MCLTVQKEVPDHIRRREVRSYSCRSTTAGLRAATDTAPERAKCIPAADDGGHGAA
jgi:hypothetical protein